MTWILPLLAVFVVLGVRAGDRRPAAHMIALCAILVTLAGVYAVGLSYRG
jgi:hypothetical protein